MELRHPGQGVARFLSERHAFLPAFTGDAKTDIVAREVCGIRASRRGAQICETGFPTAAAIDAPAARGDPARIPLWRARQWLVKIQAPFPDVARHVFEAKEAPSLRERAHRRRLRIAIVDLWVAPRESSSRVSEV